MLGNPSDLYGGKVLALSLANFRAAVTIEPADHFEIVPGADDRLSYPCLNEAAAALSAYGCEDGVRLLRAALKKVVDLRGGLGDLRDDDARLRFRLSYRTDIPRQVGLSGSSAIITAALRALLAWFALRATPAELAELALACETEELGITAGPMDRVIQAYQGVVLMDFTKPRSADSYLRLDPALLPPLFIAWDRSGGAPSRKVHSDVRLRWLQGDTEVRRAISELPSLVEEGVRCLACGDVTGLMRAVDRNFDVRASVFPLSDADRALVRLGRSQGAATKLCGSGGAVLGVMPDASLWPQIERAFSSAGFGVERARIAPPADVSES